MAVREWADEGAGNQVMTRDDLKDAIVEAAKAYRAVVLKLDFERCINDGWSQKLGDLYGESDVTRKALIDAIDALNAHDSAERERIEKHLREHAFVPGDPDGWARYTPECCDVCGKSEGEHGGGNG